MAQTKKITELTELSGLPDDGYYLIIHDGTDVKKVTYDKGRGENAKTVVLSSDSQVFRVGKDGTITPSTITFTANRQNINEASASAFSTTPAVTLSGTGNTRTMTAEQFGSNTSVIVSVSADGISDSINIIKVEEGSDSITTILSNESHNFQADATGSISSFIGGGTTIQTYEGSNLLTFTTGTAGNGEYTVSASGSSITIGSVSGNGTDTYTIGVPSSMIGNQASITYTIAGKKSNGDSFTITKIQSFTKTSAGVDGLDGSDAQTVIVSSNAQIFQVAKDGTITPSSITFTANLQNITGSATFDSSPSVTLGGSGNTRTLSASDFGNNTSVTISATAAGITDEISIVKVVEGSDALTPLLSNEAHIFQADATGSVSDYTGGGTSIKVYEGVNLLTYDGTGTSASTFKVIASGSSITTGTVSGNGTNTYLIGVPSNMPLASDVATITYTISGSKANGESFEIQKIQSFSKSKAGNAGANAKTVVVSSNAQIFQIGKDGSITPSSITFTANRQNITTAATFSASPSVTLTGTGDSRTLTSADFGNNTSVTITATADGISDEISVVKVTEGSDSITPLVTNEAHIFQAATDGTVASYTGGGTDIQVYEGANLLTYQNSLADVGNGEYTLIVSASSITAGSVGGDGTTTAEMSLPSSMVSDVASITYTITGSRSNGTNFELTKIQSFSKSKEGVAGADGSNAETVVVSSDAQLFQIAKDGTITPSSITFSVNKQNITGSTTWSSSPTVNLTGTGDSRTLSAINFGGNTSVTITATAGGISDSISVIKVNEGSDAINSLLTNEAHIFQAANNGTVSSYVGGGTDVKIYEGVNLLTYKSTLAGVGAGEYTIVKSATNITAGSISGNGTTTAQVGDPSNMTADSASVTYTITGSRLNGTDFDLTKVQSFSKSKEGAQGIQGDAGSNAKTLVATVDSQVFAFDDAADTTATPSNIIFSLNQQNLSGTLSTSDITITTAQGGTVSGYSLNTSNVSNGSGIVSGSISFSGALTSGGLNSTKANLPITISVSKDTLNDSVKVFKVEGGADGAAGADGTDAVIAFLTNESHTFVSDVSGTIASFAGGETDMEVYEGITNKTSNYTFSRTNGTGVSSTISSNTVSVTGLTSDSGSITITASSGSVSLSKVMSLSKSKQGAAGTDGTDGSSAKLLAITTDSQIFSFDDANDTTAADDSVRVYITQQNLVDAVTTSDITITGADSSNISVPSLSGTISNGSGQQYFDITFSSTLGGSKSKLPITISVSNDSLTDSTKVYKTEGGSDGADGTSPILTILSNESHTLPADSTGTVSSYAGSGTDISVYEGNNLLSYDGIGTSNGKWKVIASGSSISAGSLTDNGDTVTVANASSATQDVSNITYTISGKTANGTSFSQTKIQSFSKSKAGSAGSNAQTVALTADAYAITFDADGNESPSGQTITLTATAVNHSGTTYYEYYKGASLQGTRTTSNTFLIDTSGEKPTATTPANYTVKTYSVSSGGSVIAQDSVSLFGIKPGSAGANGTNGVNGADGADAYTVLLTNESHTLPTTNAGSVTYTGSGTSIIVYKGVTELNGITSGTPTTGQFKVTASATNITTGAISSTGNPVVVADHTSMTQDNASITYTIDVEGAATFTKTQSFSKSKQGDNGSPGAPGSNGSSAKILTLTADSQVFAFDNASDTTATPSSVIFTVTQQNLSTTFGASHLTIKDASGNVITDPTISGTVSAGSGQRTFAVSFASDLSSTKSKLPISVTASLDGLTDYYKIFKVEGGADGSPGSPGSNGTNGTPGSNGSDGTSPILGLLTNESHTLVANSAGTVSSYAGSGTEVSVYEGINQLTYDGSGTSAGTWTLTTSGSGITAGSISDSGTYATIGNHSSMNDDQASVTYAISGKTAGGNSFSFTKVQSLTKSKQGATGASGTNAKVVSLDASTLAITYDGSGTESPSGQSVTLTATQQNHGGTIYYEFLKDGVSQQNTTATTFTVDTSSEKPSAGGKVTYTVKTREGSSSGTVVSQDSVSLYGVQAGSDGSNGTPGDNGTPGTPGTPGNPGAPGSNGSNGISAVTAFLSNESQTFPATSNGSVTSFTGGSTTIYVYQGINDVTSNYTVSRTNGTGVTTTLSGATVTVTAMSHDSGSVTVTAISGSVTINKIFSLSKSKQGYAGAPGSDNQDFSWANQNLTGVGPAPAGLLMTDTVFGYHSALSSANATLADFTSYLDSSGNFYLGSGSANSYLAWDNNNAELWISGSKARVTVDQFFVGSDATQFISGANGVIEISSSNFHLDTAGNVSMAGTVSATAGSIGGFTIGSTSLEASNFVLDTNQQELVLGDTSNGEVAVVSAQDGFYCGGSNPTTAPFAVDVTGQMKSTAGSIGGFAIGSSQINDSNNRLILKNSGQITGSSVLFTGGTIGGFTLSSSQLSGGNLYLKANGQITGSEILLTRTFNSTTYTILDTVDGIVDARNNGRQIVSDSTDRVRSTAGYSDFYYYTRLLSGENSLLIDYSWKKNYGGGSVSYDINVYITSGSNQADATSTTTDVHYNAWATDYEITSAGVAGPQHLSTRSGFVTDSFTIPEQFQGQYCRIRLSVGMPAAPSGGSVSVNGFSVVATRQFASSTAGIANLQAFEAGAGLGIG